MAQKKFTVDINLNKNQLLNAVIQNLSVAPSSPNVGQLYYNTVDDTLYIWTGATWLDLGDIYVHHTQTAITKNGTGANVLASISVNTEGHVTAADTRLLTLADLGYTGATNANNYVHPTFSGNDLGAALTGTTVISDINVNNQGHVTSIVTRDLNNADLRALIINDVITSLNYTWSSDKIESEIAALSSQVAGALVYKGGYNASTNTPNLTTPTGVDQGFTYTVTTAGTFLGESLQVGDMLIAETNNPSAIGDWTVVNKNIPDIVNASTTAKGIIEIATQAEVNAGVDTTRAVTAATLSQLLTATIDGHRYSQSIGDGTATTLTVNHNLGSEDIVLKIKEVSTGITIECEEVVVDANSIQLKFNTAPTVNQYRVTILK